MSCPDVNHEYIPTLSVTSRRRAFDELLLNDANIDVGVEALNIPFISKKPRTFELEEVEQIVKPIVLSRPKPDEEIKIAKFQIKQFKLENNNDKLLTEIAMKSRLLDYLQIVELLLSYRMNDINGTKLNNLINHRFRDLDCMDKNKNEFQELKKFLNED